MWPHIKPFLRAASDDPARFTGVWTLGVDEHARHYQKRHHRDPRGLTGIMDLTRGEDHPTVRLLDLVLGRSSAVYENWLAERGEEFSSGIQIATLDPFLRYKDAIDDQLQDATCGENMRGCLSCGGLLSWKCRAGIPREPEIKRPRESGGP